MPDPWEMNWAPASSPPASGPMPWEMNWAPDRSAGARVVREAAAKIAPDANTPAAILSGIRHGISGNLGNYLDAATFGLADYAMGRAPSYSEGYARQLKRAQDIDKALLENNPASNIAGRLAGGTALGLAASPGLGYNAAQGFWPTVGAIGSFLGRNAGFGAATGAMEGDTGAERAKGAAIGGAIGGGIPALGLLGQAGINLGQSAITAGRNLFTPRGQEGMAGQVLREVSGNMPLNVAQSPVPGVELRTAQATGNPGVAGLERAMEGRIRQSATNPYDIVQGGYTPGQVQGLANAITPGRAGAEPAMLMGEASRRGVQAIEQAQEGIKKTSSELWGRLSGVKINAEPLAEYMANAARSLPENLRNSGARLSDFVTRMRALGKDADLVSPEGINGIRSDLLAAGRAASEPDVRNAYNRIAQSITQYVEQSPEIAGRAATVIPTTYNPATWTTGPTEARVPADQLLPRILGELRVLSERPPTRVVDPGIPANPGAWDLWKTARDYTRETKMAQAYPQFQALQPNAAGNVLPNPDTALAPFMNMGREGVNRLEGLGQFSNGNAIGDAARDFYRASLLRAGRGGGQDAAGQPLLNPGAIARRIDETLPSMRQTPTFAGPETTNIARAGELAKLLGRPGQVAKVAGSNTFEKFQNNQLLNAALGQAAAPVLGAVAGAGAMNYLSPMGPAVDTPIGLLGGALLASKAGAPVLNNNVLSRWAAAPAMHGIEKSLIESLRSPDEYRRLLAIRMLVGRGLSDPGRLSGATGLMGATGAPVSAQIGAMQ